ncbi:MAG: adenosylcobinamide-phosphate synthase CbiB [Candidatus Ratteibacteria bacterium]
MFTLPTITGFFLDLIFGDPKYFPHPVKFFSFISKIFERIFKKLIKNEIISGFFFSIFISFTLFSLSFKFFSFLFEHNKFLYFFFSSFFIYTSIALKDLKDHTIPIYNSLKNKDIKKARFYLSRVVRRDTENLDENEIIRATIETISENTVDGIISPIFYSFIGGAPLCLLYKVVNTLDSMVGYKNERYKYFGLTSARFDDILNFLPSRLSIFFISFSFFIYKRKGICAFKISIRDGKKNPSPNSGYPESCYAGGFGIKLGGINYYNKVMIFKPYLGDEIEKLNLNHIIESLKITYLTSFIFLIFNFFIWDFLWKF